MSSTIALSKAAPAIAQISTASDSSTVYLADNPWKPLYGLLETDPDFAAWSDEFWAEKQRSHDDDEILSVEECLRVM